MAKRSKSTFCPTTSIALSTFRASKGAVVSTTEVRAIAHLGSKHGSHSAALVWSSLELPAMPPSRDRRGQDPSRLWMPRKGERGRPRGHRATTRNHQDSSGVSIFPRCHHSRSLIFLVQDRSLAQSRAPLKSSHIFCRALSPARTSTRPSAVCGRLCFSAHQRARCTRCV
jgi:hypothetical protein